MAFNFLQLPESQMSCLYLKNTKNSKTTKIEGLPTGFEGQDNQEKRHTNLMCDSQNKSSKETPPKASRENPKKELRKSPKREKRERHNQALRNHTESSIHTKEVHTRSSLPPDHPSLSQDLTMKLSS
jgi:hypothetical protein